MSSPHSDITFRPLRVDKELGKRMVDNGSSRISSRGPQADLIIDLVVLPEPVKWASRLAFAVA
jgi:hypothetical protein